MLTVEQVDREAAARYAGGAGHEYWLANAMDSHPLIQAFAAHRIAGEQAIVAWLRGLGYTAICPGSYFADRIELGEHLSAIRALKGPQG